MSYFDECLARFKVLLCCLKYDRIGCTYAEGYTHLVRYRLKGSVSSVRNGLLVVGIPWCLLFSSSTLVCLQSGRDSVKKVQQTRGKEEDRSIMAEADGNIPNLGRSRFFQLSLSHQIESSDRLLVFHRVLCA